MINKNTPKWFLEKIISPACNNNKQIINAFAQIPRGLFMESAMQPKAYEDNALPIGMGQTISQPSLVAHMLNILELEKTDRVLEIGSGSGFVTALLSKIVKTIYAIERIPQLFEKSRLILRKMNITNAKLLIGNGADGWSEYAPFDKIIASAGATTLPKKLIEQLNNNGIMIIPLNNKLMKYRKVNGIVNEEIGINVSFVDFIGS